MDLHSPCCSLSVFPKPVCFLSQSWHLCKPHNAKLADLSDGLPLRGLHAWCQTRHCGQAPSDHPLFPCFPVGPEGWAPKVLAGHILTALPKPPCKTRFEISSKTVRKRFEIGSRSVRKPFGGIVLEPFWNRFGIVSEPFCKTLPQSVRNRFESGSKSFRKPFGESFWNRFGIVLEPFWNRFGRPLCKETPRQDFVEGPFFQFSNLTGHASHTRGHGQGLPESSRPSRGRKGDARHLHEEAAVDTYLLVFARPPRKGRHKCPIPPPSFACALSVGPHTRSRFLML